MTPEQHDEFLDEVCQQIVDHQEDTPGKVSAIDFKALREKVRPVLKQVEKLLSVAAPYDPTNVTKVADMVLNVLIVADQELFQSGTLVPSA